MLALVVLLIQPLLIIFGGLVFAAMLDRDESAMHAAQMSMTGRALLDDGAGSVIPPREAPNPTTSTKEAGA